MDPYRLPRTAIPLRYDIHLEPDLSTFRFRGRETISLDVSAPLSELVLNAVDLEVEEVEIVADGKPPIPASVVIDEPSERWRLAFPSTVMPGRWQLRLAFRGALNDKLRGFYRSAYPDPNGGTRWMAATQFQATDARRAFPCWDEPAFKAVFAVTLAVDPALTALSNTRVIAERTEAGKRVVQFADTIVMSSYLVAFVVGELAGTEPVTVGGTPLRVWSVPAKRQLASFGRDAAAASLAFFEAYYGVPYPGDKLDLVAIPDFAAGAMENLGAIAFRETALLIDEQQASRAELQRVADVVSHENAHMWFGDLVTMKWWNGIWLNEAFATFMEMLAVDAWRPEWRRWATFGVSRAAALVVDALNSTRPVEFPVAAPREAEAMFDVLTYEKGAAVLRMLEQYLGADVFRDGVRDYLRTHAHGNADTVDLWAALGRVARQPIPEIMDGWIFAPGYPLIDASLDQGELLLTQRRFGFSKEPLAGTADQASPDATAPLDGQDDREQLWKVPLQVKVVAAGATTEHRLLLSAREARVAVPDDAEVVIVNAGAHGFYRVRYRGGLLEKVLRASSLRLSAVERFGLVDDAWAITLAGQLAIGDFLDVTARFRDETDRNVWSVLIGAFGYLNRLIESADRPRLAALVRDRLSPTLAAIGWTPRPGDDDLTRQLRGELCRALGILGDDPTVQKRAADLYAGDHGAIDPNLLPAVIGILAHAGDVDRYEDFRARFRRAATPQEEQRYLYALTGFRQPALVEQTLARTIDGEIRTQDAPLVARSLLMSVHGRELAWDFVKSHWDTMDRLFAQASLRYLCEGVQGLATPELEEDVVRFFAERRIDLGGKVLAQCLEHLRVAVAFRERERAGLASYLSRFA